MVSASANVNARAWQNEVARNSSEVVKVVLFLITSILLFSFYPPPHSEKGMILQK